MDAQTQQSQEEQPKKPSKIDDQMMQLEATLEAMGVNEPNRSQLLATIKNFLQTRKEWCDDDDERDDQKSQKKKAQGQPRAASASAEDEDEPRQKRHVPPTFKLSRKWIQQAPQVEMDLLSAILNPQELKGTGVTVSERPKSITDYALTCYVQATQQILYNQSVKSKNDDVNSGFMRLEATRTEGFSGAIFPTLNELCQMAYGTDDPTTLQKRQMRDLIQAVDRYEADITFPNGDRMRLKVVAVMGTYIRDDGAIAYHLALNPVFCGNALASYGEFPQDINRRLRVGAKRVSDRAGLKRSIRLSSALLRLTQYLGMQDKRKPFTWAVDNMMKYLGLTDAYKKDRKRTQETINDYFEVLKEIRLLSPDSPGKPNPGIGITGDKVQTFIFRFSPDFRLPYDVTEGPKTIIIDPK